MAFPQKQGADLDQGRVAGTQHAGSCGMVEREFRNDDDPMRRVWSGMRWKREVFAGKDGVEAALVDGVDPVQESAAQGLDELGGLRSPAEQSPAGHGH